MKNATKIISTLTKKGFKAYFVGGHVRDILLRGESSGDIDITTSAHPEEVMSIFSKDHTVIPTGIDHGTVTIMIENIPYEITTFRREISTDGRNATVKFAKTLEEDLKRRDFTINALCYCPLTNTYLDPFHGKEDLKKGIIRCVGSPFDRFKEDYLRMFRALRFKSTLKFELDSDVRKGIIHLAQDKWENHVSIERIKMEIDKCFEKADRPSSMFIDMQITGLLKKFMPELSRCFNFEQNKHHKYDVFHHTMYTMDAVSKEYPLIRWAGLFHDLGKYPSRRFEEGDYTFHGHEMDSEKISIEIMKRMKFSNEDIKYISNLVRHHMFQHKSDMKDSAIRRFVSSLGVENVDAILILKHGDRSGNGKKKVTDLNIESTSLKRRFKEIVAKQNAFKITDLAVSGKDVMAVLSISPSPAVGRMLKMLFEIVIEDPEKNTREFLMEDLRQFKEERFGLFVRYVRNLPHP